MSDTEYTPSTGNVRSAWEVYHREYGRLTFEEAGPAFDRWLAAVEAAVRADQIERDAGIAGRDHKPSGYGIGALNSGSRSQWYSRGRDQAAAAIRAQLTEGKSDE